MSGGEPSSIKCLAKGDLVVLFVGTFRWWLLFDQTFGISVFAPLAERWFGIVS